MTAERMKFTLTVDLLTPGESAAGSVLEADPAVLIPGLYSSVCCRPSRLLGLWSQQGHRAGKGEASLPLLAHCRSLPAEAQPRSTGHKGP